MRIWYLVERCCFDCLNPYSNGIYSMRGELVSRVRVEFDGLNPYSNGIYSMRHQ